MPLGGRRHRRLLTAVLAAAGVAALAGCGAAGDGGAPGTPEGDRPPTVVATTTILGDLVRNVAGNAAEVVVLMPVGADPHDYAASARDGSVLASADLVVANGLGLEASLVDALDTAAADGARVLELAPLLDPIPLGGDGSERCDVAAGSCDPHVWTDPVRMAEAARLVAAELAAVDDTGPWVANADAYAAELDALAGEINGALAAIPASERILVTNHDALGYFAARYGFEVVATVIPGGDTRAAPSSSELADLVALVRDRDVPVIFAETIEPAALAEAVAAEVGDEVEVVELYTDSLGEPGSGADTLAGMLRTDAGRIAEALG